MPRCCHTPFDAATRAENDPNGGGWYLRRDIDGAPQIWDVFAFGPDWVLTAPADDPHAAAWHRWESLAPLTIELDGVPVR